MKTGLGTFKIGEHVYKFEALAPIEGLRFGTQCAKILGPTLTTVLDVVSRWNSEKMTIGDVVTSVSPALGTVDEEKFEGLMKTAFSRVYTPMNENLGDEAAFNSWFQDHMPDMFPVGLVAIYHLAKDFFPKLPATKHTPSPTSGAAS